METPQPFRIVEVDSVTGGIVCFWVSWSLAWAGTSFSRSLGFCRGSRGNSSTYVSGRTVVAGPVSGTTAHSYVQILPILMARRALHYDWK